MNAKQFALIWWESGNTDIVDLKSIKIKDRFEGVKTKLMWSDISGVRSQHMATIIKIGSELDLEKISVDQYGHIIETDQKAFSKDVLNTRVGNKKLEKETEIEKTKNSILQEKEILSTQTFINSIASTSNTNDKRKSKPQNSKTHSAKKLKFKSEGSSNEIGSHAKHFEQNRNTDTAELSLIKNKNSMKNITSDEGLRSSLNTTNNQFIQTATTVEKNDDKFDKISKASSLQQVDGIVSDEDDQYEDNSHMDSKTEDIANNKYLVFIPNVTEEHLAFQERLVACMKYSLFTKEKSNLTENLKKINQELLETGDDKVEIFRKSGVYFEGAHFNVMLFKYKNHKDWKKFATEFFVQVYDQNLKFMSAKGTRGTFGIHVKVFNAVYNIVNENSTNFVSDKEFVKHLNKLCANRKSTSFVKN